MIQKEQWKPTWSSVLIPKGKDLQLLLQDSVHRIFKVNVVGKWQRCNFPTPNCETDFLYQLLHLAASGSVLTQIVNLRGSVGFHNASSFCLTLFPPSISPFPSQLFMLSASRFCILLHLLLRPSLLWLLNTVVFQTNHLVHFINDWPYMAQTSPSCHSSLCVSVFVCVRTGAWWLMMGCCV